MTCSCSFFTLPVFVGISYRDRDVAFLVPLLDIAVRLDDLFERIDPVNDRFELARLDRVL